MVERLIMITKDWRADIKKQNSLNDLDPREVMVFMRHYYMDRAKDLIKSSFLEDQNIGLECAQIAEALEFAIELQCDENSRFNRLIDLESA